jgi:hypothetical protein
MYYPQTLFDRQLFSVNRLMAEEALNELLLWFRTKLTSKSTYFLIIYLFVSYFVFCFTCLFNNRFPVFHTPISFLYKFSYLFLSPLCFILGFMVQEHV